MKCNGLKLLILLGFIIPLTNLQCRGQAMGFEGFSVKVSPGALCYYGELSNDDLNLPKRIAVGSKFGIGVSIIKQFSPSFGIQAQYLTGSLYTAAPDNTYFAASLSEFNLSARFDPIRLFKKKSFRLSPFVSAGVGTFNFRSVRREIGTNLVLLPAFGYNIDGVTNSTKQTALSLPLTVGLSYQILPNIQVELEHGLRMTNTDLLDCFKGTGPANDYYSLTSISVRFTIPTRSGNNGKSDALPDNEPVKEDKPIDSQKTDIPVSYFYVACEMPEIVRNGQTISVKLRVVKGKYTGKAKLVQKFPDGFTVVDSPNENNLLSFTNQNLTIEWERMPVDSILIFNYQLKIGEKVTGNQNIIGRLEYQQPADESPISFNKSIFVENSNPIAEKELPINQLVKQYDSVDSPKTNRVTRANIKPSQALSGIEFRVQCGAFRDKNQADTHLAVKYSIVETIQEEFTDGWYKYTVGSFRTYAEAAGYRDKFIARTKILSSFIVAYKDGHRLKNFADAFK